jgi:hypothetical protein
MAAGMPLNDPNATGPTLHRIVSASLDEHGWLLTDPERAAVQAYLALPPGAGHLYARLLHRVREVLRDDGLDDRERACLPRLEADGLLDRLVPDEQRLALLKVPELVQLCQRLELPSSGRRASLLERLQPHAGAVELAAHRVLHRGLFQRMQSLFLRHPRADYRVVVLDAIGVMPRPSYTPTPCASPFPDRAAMLEFEQARALLDRCREGEPALPFLPLARAWLADSPPPGPGQRHFSTRRVAAVLASLAARELERSEHPSSAADIYQALLDDGTLEPGALLPRAMLATEASGHPARALALAERWRPHVDPAAALAVDRTARRLARKLDRAWCAPALRSPPTRQLALPGAGSTRRSARPLYQARIDGRTVAVPVEQAVLAAVPTRRLLHGESAPWTTLFALLLADLYFLPVPGMLPVAWLSGPLDLGRPAFAEQRRAQLDARLAEIRAGAAPSLIQARWQRYAGQALGGARWDRASAEDLDELATALGGAALADIIGRLAHEGWHAARGLPDLVVLPGPAAPLPGPRAGTLPPGMLLAEVKGPGDQVRDAQAAWFHRLLEAGVGVELWKVERLPSHGFVAKPG